MRPRLHSPLPSPSPLTACTVGGGGGGGGGASIGDNAVVEKVPGSFFTNIQTDCNLG